MDLHYLRIFYEVAKEGSFTKAANRLYINQSAVSIQVKKFEEILNTKLFDRSSKKIKLTYSGEVLYVMAEEIFQKVKRAEKEIKKVIEESKAKIAIGASPILGESIMPRVMKEFSISHKEVEFSIRVAEKRTLLRLLSEGDLDAILLDAEHITDPNLEVIDINEFPYVLVSNKIPEDFEDIFEEPLISRKEIINNEKAINLVEDEYKNTFKKKIFVRGSHSVIKSMVVDGMGSAILPYYSISKEIKNKSVYVLKKVDNIKDSYHIVITKDKGATVEIGKFIEFMKGFEMIKEGLER